MWWHILNTSADADIKTVKKAYAHIVKDIDQDTQIEEFTKLNEAYRLALQSFKKEGPRNFLLGDSDDELYKTGLKQIYDNPRRRILVKYWKSMFAIMSFKEEESFKHEYVDFFNEHYGLPTYVWKFIETKYPLNNQKKFKWKDLSNGNLLITEEELKALESVEGVNNEKKVEYIEGKIQVFLLMSEKKYTQAYKIIKSFIEQFEDNVNAYKWLMICAVGSGDDELIQESYKQSVGKASQIADYYMAGHYAKQGRVAKNGQGELPWTELDGLTTKEVKLLQSGAYNKVFGGEHKGKKGLFGFGRG